MIDPWFYLNRQTSRHGHIIGTQLEPRDSPSLGRRGLWIVSHIGHQSGGSSPSGALKLSATGFLCSDSGYRRTLVTSKERNEPGFLYDGCGLKHNINHSVRESIRSLNHSELALHQSPLLSELNHNAPSPLLPSSLKALSIISLPFRILVTRNVAKNRTLYSQNALHTTFIRFLIYQPVFCRIFPESVTTSKKIQWYFNFSALRIQVIEVHMTCFVRTVLWPALRRFVKIPLI